MPSDPVIDIAALIAPIPGDDPAGTPLPFTLKQTLDTERRTSERDPEDPSRMVPRDPDWNTIRDLTVEALVKTSKDLEAAVRLVEAIVNLHGFAGLRDGLRLLHDMTEQCWDRMYPKLEEPDDVNLRISKYNWISRADSVGPKAVYQAPMVVADSQKLNHQDVAAVMKGSGPVRKDALDRAQPVDPHVVEHINESIEEVAKLEKLLDPKCKPAAEAPSWSGLKEALEACRFYASKLIKTSGTATTQNGNGQPVAGQGHNSGDVTSSRKQLYDELKRIADNLEQLDPHSPIPDMLRRAHALGQLPFRKLMQEWVRDAGLRETLLGGIGLKAEEAHEASPETSS